MSICRSVHSKDRAALRYRTVVFRGAPFLRCWTLVLLGVLGFLVLVWPCGALAQLSMVADAPAGSTLTEPDADPVERGVRIERDPHPDIRIQRFAPERFPALPEAVPQVNDLLAEAWDRFRFKEYSEALVLFSQAEDLANASQAKREARLGRAYALAQLTEWDMARELLASLLDAEYRREEVGPALAWVLLELDLPDQAAAVLEGLELDAVPIPSQTREALHGAIESRLAAAGPDKGPDDAMALEAIGLAWQDLDQFAPGSAAYRRAAEKLLAKAPDDAAVRERLAWDAFHAGLYADALGHFTALRRLRPVRVTELQGHATALQHLGRVSDAIALLEQSSQLAQPVIRAQLAGLYAAEGRRAYEAGEDAQAATMLMESLLLDPADVGRRELLAWVYLRQNKPREAGNLFQALRGDRPDDPGLLLGEALALRAMGRSAKALALLDQYPIPADDLVTLRRELIAEVAREAVAAGDDHRAEQLYRRLLTEHPSREALLGLAWAVLRQDRPAQARDMFLEQLAKRPDDSEAQSEALYGAIAAWRALDRPDAALALLEDHEEVLPADLENIRPELLLESALQLRAQGRDEEAIAALRRSLVLEPNAPKAQELLAWTLFETGRFGDAHRHFMELFRTMPTPARASVVLLSLSALGDADGAVAFASTLADAEDQDLRIVAAEYYQGMGRHIRAAQVDTRPETGYAGCADPALDSFAVFRSRSGDRGLTRLGVIALPTELVMPESSGGAWNLYLEPQHLFTGDAPHRPFAGSFFNTVQDPEVRPGRLETSAQVLTAELRHVSDGPVRRTVAAGVTPVGGTIAPRPTFQVRFERENRWFIEGRQHSVTDTFLSALGRSDPYGARSWGRVLESGLRAGWTIPLAADWWVNLEAEYGYLWGKNVADNYRLGGALAVGRTREMAFGTLSTGLFVAADHYARNQNHQTFGHGGYFSPEHFIIAGPFLRVSTHPADSDFFADVRLSLGYMHYQAASAPRYHKVGELPNGLSDPARQELFGSFPGQRESSLAVNVEAELFHKVAARWDIGGFGGVNSGSDHTQWHVGVGLRFAFQPRGGACRLRGR
ncbi:cellulose synthase subunit BcsC-related outer membrane protein [Desulfonatronum thioautotrophicum]|uniref:cellulose synthase subunit BcsC-related outer membrane protein n=1 Tax=Desulfonatronum thioautotrophicum TaxID=617001 RepID=UPI0005EBC559|nr:cellulose synthase subunit BcsC-related outer membrane protein [Desulfonatronum thioautotrophicum]